MSSRVLSVATIIEKNKIASKEPFLVFLEVDVIDPITKQLIETFRLVRNTEDVTYQDVPYAAMAFEVELKQEAGGQSTVQLTIADYTRAVQERMQSYGGGIGSGVRIMVVNAGNLQQPPEIKEYFTVVGASSQNYVVTWTLGAQSILAVTFPRRRELRNRCAWRYKSAECGYTGDKTTCDLSLQGENGCAAHNNTLRYGGFPGINSNGVRYA